MRFETGADLRLTDREGLSAETPAGERVESTAIIGSREETLVDADLSIGAGIPGYDVRIPVRRRTQRAYAGRLRGVVSF